MLVFGHVVVDEIGLAIASAGLAFLLATLSPALDQLGDLVSDLSHCVFLGI
jgi:hypothetical protein